MRDQAWQRKNLPFLECLVKALNVGRMSLALSDNVLILLGYAIANPTYILFLQHPPLGGWMGKKRWQKSN
jgi:hypothetical protein